MFKLNVGYTPNFYVNHLKVLMNLARVLGNAQDVNSRKLAVKSTTSHYILIIEIFQIRKCNNFQVRYKHRIQNTVIFQFQ